MTTSFCRPPRNSSRFLPVAALLATSLTASCMLLQPKDTTPPSSSRSHRARSANLCSVEEGQERLVFMPNGQYAGSWESGTGMLELKDDQSFFLRYKNRYTGSETQWNGRFEWKKQGIGEVLNLCDIRKATNARMQEGTASQSTAVFGINHERHRFEVSLSGVGKMVFNKKES